MSVLSGSPPLPSPWIALSASIYMPAVSYMNESTRSAVSGGMGLNQAMGWSFPPIESIVFLLPSSMSIKVFL